VLLIAYGLRPNRYMADIMPGRLSAQAPDERGEFGTRPARETVVLLLLGMRTNQYVPFPPIYIYMRARACVCVCVCV